jgi:hypothetical protein
MIRYSAKQQRRYKMPVIEFESGDTILDVIKFLKEDFNTNNEIIIQVGKKSWAKLEYVKYAS